MTKKIKTPRAVEKWFEKVKPMIRIKDKKTGKTLDVLNLMPIGDKVYVFHNGAFDYKSTNGKERNEYFQKQNKKVQS